MCPPLPEGAKQPFCHAIKILQHPTRSFENHLSVMHLPKKPSIIQVEGRSAMRTTAFLAAHISLVLMLLPLPAAQQTVNTPAALSGVDSSQFSYTDVFIGRNTRGPYLLSWKGVRARSERVIVDGKTLRRDEEYTIDYAAGTLVFHQPLRKESMAQVTYEVDPSKAQRNPQTV